MNRFCRSDQVNYVHHDVPVTYFSTGYAQDYHQPTDEPQYIDYDHMARIGTVHSRRHVGGREAEGPAGDHRCGSELPAVSLTRPS